MKHLILILALTCLSLSAFSQNCLKLAYTHEPENGYNNPDSIMVDTCNTPINFSNIYAKKYFEIVFNIEPFGLSQYQADTTIKLSISDIDTIHSTLISDLNYLDSMFGQFTFIKKFPDIVDTNHLATYTFLLEFNSIVCIDSVLQMVSSFNDIKNINYIERYFKELSIPNDPSFDPSLGPDIFYQKNINNTSNNPDGLLFYPGGKMIYKEGFEWTKYDIHIPLAWEITKGKRKITLGFYDSFWVQDEDPWEPEISIKNDEFLYFDNQYDTEHQKFIPLSSIRSFNSNNVNINEKYYSRHGGGVTSVAITNSNNNLGFSGISPNCKFINSNTTSGHSFEYLDLSSNVGRQTIHVMSSSVKGVTSFLKPMQSGIVTVQAVGNEIPVRSIEDRWVNISDYDDWLYQLTLWYQTNSNSFSIQVDQSNKKIYLKLDKPTWLQSTAKSSYDSYSNKLLKVIGVGGVGRTTPANSDLVSWDPRIDLEIPNTDNKFYDFALNNTNFISHFIYSPGTNPFPTTGSISEKNIEKSQAQIDVVVPASNVLSIREDGLLLTQQSGASYAAPQVSGVIALMRSIDENFNLSITNITNNKDLITDGGPIHSRAYDILTFTTEKLVDNQEFVDDQVLFSKTLYRNDIQEVYEIILDFPPFYDNQNSSLQFEYIIQSNDLLKRSWAQRMGFGMVNAFRAVTHSIRNKAPHTCSTTTTLSFTTGEGNENENNQMLMHMGAYNQNGDLVLEHGGNKFDGTYPDYNNCHGTTYLNSVTENSVDVPVELTVPNNCILSIDGALKHGTGPSCENKISTSGSGKILITGYLRDVKLEGLIKTDDLDIYSSSPDGYGTLTFNSSGTTSENSEIYGIVNLNDDSKIEMIEVSGNILVIQPGGEIHFNGSKGITIPDGATLELAYGAEIIKEASADVSVSIIVQDGGTLKIRKGAAVTIDVPIIVEPGGKLIFEDNTLAWIDEIIIMENDGENAGLVFNTDASKLGTWLLPAENKTGKVTIMPGTSLYIPEVDKTSHTNVKEIAILGGVNVWGEYILDPINGNQTKVGQLVVNEEATFVCGGLNSGSFTHIEFNKGSKISFVSDNADRCYGVSNISINGNLTAVGDASIPIEISGWKGPNKYTNTLFPNNTPQVYANISMGTDFQTNAQFPSNPTANFKYVKFTDVTIKTIDSHLEELISCNFLYNSSNFKTCKENENIKNLYSTYKPNAILSVNRLLPVWDPVNFGPNLTLTNCTFKDEAAPAMTWLTAENTNNVPDYDYHLNGVYVQGLRNVTIDNSDLVNDNEQFKGLNSAVHTVNCSRVVVRNCSLSTSRRGFEDYGSSVNLCQNYTYRVNVPHSINNSKKWATFGNKFEQSNKASVLVGTISGQNFRGNYFDDFYNGLYMDYSRAYLRGELTSDPNDNPALVDKLGRNELIIPELIVENSYHEFDRPNNNPFTDPLKNKYDIQSRSDIFFFYYPFDATDPDRFINFENNTLNERRPLKIQCGKNKMGEYTPSHLYYYQLTTENYPNINVVPNYNDWLPTSAIRNNSLISIGEPNNNLNEHELRITECTEILTEIQCEQYVPLVQPCDFYVRNAGNWPFEQNPDVVLDNDFYAYLNDFCNGILSCDCYRQRLFELVQLASLGDSTDQKLEMVIDCILDKLNDPVYNTVLNCNISDLMLNLGESYERRGLFDDALDAYYYVLSNTQNSTDTTLARWRVLNLEAVQQDTTYGFVYDSLMKEYFSRVDYDITKTYIHSGGSNPPPKISIESSENNEESLPIGVLEQNAPNPFTNETVIKFRLNKEADVRLAIHNNLGHTVKVLVNQRLMPGNFIYTFFNDGLSSGIYLYLLTTEGKQFTKKMQLIK